MVWIRIFLSFYAGLVGMAIGSFLNVVVWRLPRGGSLVHPPSACPACGHRLRTADLVPVVSWLALHGRCRYCGSPIAIRYPLVEFGTALVFAFLAAGYGFSVWILPPLAMAILLIPAGLIAHDAAASAPRGRRFLYRLLSLLAAAGLLCLMIRPWLSFPWLSFVC